jgi:hypothetical protein
VTDIEQAMQATVAVLQGVDGLSPDQKQMALTYESAAEALLQFVQAGVN